MANKPIISIDVNADQFKAFYELFQQFEAKVETMPKEWHEIDAAVRRTSTAAKTLSSTIQSSTEAQRQFNIMAREGLQTMSKMAKEAGNVGKAVFDIGKWLLKFGAIGAGIAGLGGILGTLSLRDLAHSAVTDQRGARGVGLTTGQYKAFGMDFGRFLDPSILSNVANAQNSYQGRVWLGMATGLGYGGVQGQGADQLAMRLATRAHDWWVNTPASQRTAENLSASGFTQSGLTLEDMRRLGNTPMSELRSAQAQYGQDQRSLNVGAGATQAWYEFDRQITLAGRTIETSLTNRLVELAPSLRSFVTTFAKDVDQLINQILTPANLKGAEEFVGDMAKYLGSPEFRQDMKDFAGLIGVVAQAIRGAAELLGVGKGSEPSTASKIANTLNILSGGKSSDGSTLSSMWSTPLAHVRHSMSMPSNPKGVLADIEKRNGLPPGSLSAVWGIESNSGQNLEGPRLKNGDQAIGDFQFTSSTWGEWGNGGDRYNFSQSADAAGRYLGSLYKRNGNDIRKALAAYNWGPGNLAGDIAANGAQWDSHLPAETRKYLDKFASALANQKVNVNVKVSNSTAARVAVQANAAAAGM
ncbi:transglycosylase SLT domain-containing protein [Burkholderia glumae]|uniref:transglycosylase SLT domain-containing protein n=1 Tax=Burkholderia glumae TaxID=337 RepID=UPI002036B544|nr:transglycosylase SLT domain-containing protein [Burkholderia glumae]MCM2493313.1 transglycosylase SLT domain-containing protein [Burkholderia glumae]